MRARGGHWTIAQGAGAVDIASAGEQELSAGVETPEGWIRPVKVLTFSAAKPRSQHAIVTVLQPRATGAPGAGELRVTRRESALDVQVGADRIHFQKTPDGWRIVSVTTGGAARR